MQALTSRAGIAIIGKEHRVAFPQAAIDAIKQNTVDSLTRFHRDSPQALGIEIAVLRKQLAPALSAVTYTALLRDLADEKKIEIAGSSVRLPRHIATDNPADEKMWQALRPLLDGAGFNILPLRELAPASGIKEAILKDFLHRKARTGEVIRVTPERFYPRATLAQLAAVAQVVAGSAPAGFSAAQYRDRSGVGRGLAIEILECLDRLGITQRIGDVRKMRKDFEPLLGPATAPPPPAVKPQAAPKPAAQPQRRDPPSHFKR
jgi:selenocysteine-specific elongation factor